MWLIDKLTEDWILGALILLLGTAVGIVVTDYHVGAFAWANYHFSRARFGFRVFRNRIGIRVVTLDDYVALLEQLRESLVRYRPRLPDASTLHICVLTMQLPRDWPLWASSTNSATPDKSALEQYFLNFGGFLRQSEVAGASVDVKRIIVIQNAASPAGKQKLAELREDVNSDYFQTYIRMLHATPSQALFYPHNRPWPGWLADAVFYGISTNGAIRWLWGVTTSYNAGEDLILLRYHRMSKRHLSRRFALPWGARSLPDLLSTMTGVSEIQPLDTLRPHPAAPPKPASPLAIPAATSVSGTRSKRATKGKP